MGPATIRRLASAAALVLLALVWCRPAGPPGFGGPAHGVEASDRPMVARGLTGAGASPAVLRQSHAGWWLHGTRPDQAKGALAVALLALVLLVRRVLWGRPDGTRSAPSPLARRRHVIALRAPPLPRCV